MADVTNLESLLKASFWNQMQRVHTAIPCVILDVQNDLNEQRITVQPCIDILNEDGTTSQRSAMVNVPLIFPASSSSALTFPVFKGDNVVCLFSMRAMEIFNETDGLPAPPNNLAKFNQKDAMAIPGLFPRKSAINNPNKRTNTHSTLDTVLAHNIGESSEVEIRLKPNGDMIINTTGFVQVNSGTAEINTEVLTVNAETTNWNGDINHTGNLNHTGSQIVSGDVIAGGKSLISHTHNMPSIQNGDTTKPTTPPL